MGWFSKRKDNKPEIRPVVEQLASMLEDFSAWEVNGDTAKFLKRDGKAEIKHKEKGFRLTYSWEKYFSIERDGWYSKIGLPENANFSLNNKEFRKLDAALEKIMLFNQENLEAKRYNKCFEMVMDTDMKEIIG